MDYSISFVSLVLLVAVAHAASTPQDYWKTTLPNTPMPNAIRDLFRPDVGVGAEAMANAHFSVEAFKKIYGNRHYGVVESQKVIVPDEAAHFSVEAFKKIYGNRHYGVVASQKVIVPDEAVFFLEKDLQHGQKLRLDFTRGAPAVAFLPRGAANAIPFSSEKLPTILNHFSIQPNSVTAKFMKQVLWRCELQDPAEKSKHCATSLESMVDYVTATLGTRDVRTLSLEVKKGGARSQQYMVQQSPHMQEAAEESYAVCHPEVWPYAVFYCHVIPTTRAYVVGLAGEDGTRVDAVAVCHMDTSTWSPKHLAFQMTKVKPGTVPICHFLPQGDIVWAPKTRGSQIP